MFIRVWDSIGSMVDLFAIVGQIEKHFGRVLDFTAPRDSDVKGTFCADVAAIPREGKVIQVPDPKVDATLLGGVFIRDTQEYLDAGNRENYLHEGAEILPFPKEVKVIDVKIGTQLVARWSGMLPAKNRRDLSVSSKQDAVESGSGSRADDVEMSQQGGVERVLAGTLKTSNILSSSSHLSPESSHIDASNSKPLVTSTPTHTHTNESTPASQPPLGDTPLSTAPPQDACDKLVLQEYRVERKGGRWILLTCGGIMLGRRPRKPRSGYERITAEGSRVGELWPSYGDLWVFSRPENTRNAESEGSEEEKQSPQELTISLEWVPMDAHAFKAAATFLCEYLHVEAQLLDML
ncbi:hypothetical protein BU17DRAFT_70563 [Hysterangium stoloniferum]|nr:hypothetical protein BU17DRAFT_70563 [Hysterangium stoloniferum]